MRAAVFVIASENRYFHYCAFGLNAVDLDYVIKLDNACAEQVVFYLERVYAQLKRHKGRVVNAYVTFSFFKNHSV